MTPTWQVVEVGEELELDVGPVAHGGHCVARHDGQVVFVRHALPGERVLAVVTSRTTRFLRADAVTVLSASPGRVDPPCRFAHPGGCGGCDWQHADLPTQRALKTTVVREQLRRLGGVDVEVVVDEAPGATDGLGWRTRESFSIDPATGRPGLLRHRSHEVEPVDTCLIGAPDVLATGVLGRAWPGARRVEVVGSSTGDVVVAVDGAPVGRARVRERALGREWRVGLGSFWQVHPAAAETLAGAVEDLLDVRPGDHALDLYAGVGLFSALLASKVGPQGRVDAVEASEAAVRDARRNLHDLGTVRLHQSGVEEWLVASPGRSDVVVLDPPRTGAGRRVLEAIAGRSPRSIGYVACDPAALGRDVRTLGDLGYRLAGLRAYDLFPMTHHVECVAGFERR